MVKPGRLRRFLRNTLPEPTVRRLRAVRQRVRTYRAVQQKRPPAKVGSGEGQDGGVPARLFHRLRQGESLEQAAAATVRDLVHAGDVDAAVSFADALADRQDTARTGHLAGGIVAAHRKLPELAAAEFADVPPGVWRPHALGEYLGAAYRTDPASTVATVRGLVADRPDDVDEHGWFEAVRYAFAAGELELARAAYALLVDRAGPAPSEWAADQIAWLRPWMTRERAASAPQPPQGHVPFALLDYRQPGKSKTSQNIGDHVQTLASIGHLVRRRNVRFHGPAKLVDLIDELQRGVREDRRLDTPASDVTLYTAHRDASNFDAFPAGTWALAFGWYMHPLFGLRHDFPLHPNLRPIFVSFHCNKRELLTGETVDYLRRYGPVGCRDWTTVGLLLSIGVPAYFSGCLTTTVDTIFPPADAPAEKATVYVDVAADKRPGDAIVVKQSYRAVKARSFVRNLRDAVKLLERYRREYTTVVTSRLHCYLPARSLGVQVVFQPKSRADVRFNGLIDIDDAAFDKIRGGMLARLEPVLSAILAGGGEDEVYALWRELCADDVEAARQRHDSVLPLPAHTQQVQRATGKVAAAASHHGRAVSGAVDVVIPVGSDDVDPVRRTVESVLAKASRPVRLWLPSWGLEPADRAAVVDACGDAAVTWLPCDGLSADEATVLLPELLGEAASAVLLPPAAVVLGDIAALADRDLGGRALAARTSLGTAASGFGRLYRAAKRLHPDAELAHELFLRMHARHRFDFDAFDPQVLVLDLARLRADDMSAELLPYLERFGLTAAEALLLYTGPDRDVLPPEWAHAPVNERLADPQLVQWPGSAKPWQRPYVAGRQYWQVSSAR